MLSSQGMTYFVGTEEISNSYLFQRVEEEEKKVTVTKIIGRKQKSCYGQEKLKQNPQGTDHQVLTPPKKKKDPEEALNGNIKSGHWSTEENKKYHWFLEIYNSHFMNKHLRRMDKIFKTMSTFIASREAEQCRSHHQKMEKKHRSFSKILLSLRRQHYGNEETAQLDNQLTSNGLSSPNGLLPADILQMEEEIKNIESPKTSSEIEVKFQQQKFQNQERKQVDIIADLFSDQKYENNLGFFWV